MKEKILILNYTVFTGILILNSVFTLNKFFVYFLFILFFTSYTARRLFLYDEEWSFLEVLNYIEIIIVSLISIFSKSPLALIMLLFLVDEPILKGTGKKEKVKLLFIYIIFAFSIFALYGGNERLLLIIFLVSLPIYLVVITLYTILFKLLVKTEEAKKNLTLLVIKNIEKDKLYEEYEALSIKNERSRIASEIHDSVGHNLTAALTQMEASKRLIDRDKEASRERLEIARSQVKEGLNEIRRAVRILDEKSLGEDFKTTLITFIKNCEKNFSIDINYEIESLDYEEETSLVIFRALKEGITNGVRHGKGTRFTFNLYCEEGVIYFILEDNGVGTEYIKTGYGLREMKGRVDILGGNLKLYSKVGEGFKIEISLPYMGERND